MVNRYSGWYGVDLDGTLAMDIGGSVDGIGPPVPKMLERVKRWIALGIEVRIVTARVSDDDPAWVLRQRELIEAWCQEHLGCVLRVTAQKDYQMVALYDDRAVHVVRNDGRTMVEMVQSAFDLIPDLMKGLFNGAMSAISETQQRVTHRAEVQDKGATEET